MSDKYFSQVQLLCGFNGADGATAFTDESAAARVATFVANAQLDTAQAKWGSASALFDGTGDSITFPDAAALELLDGDFTFECFVRFSTVALADFIAKWQGSAGLRSWIFGYIHASTELRFVYSTNGTASVSTLRTWAPAADTWYHVAAAREGINLRLFVDGVQLGTTANIGTASFHDATTAVSIGSTSPGINSLNGWIDEARLTVGRARYTANFAPPQGPFSRGKRLGVTGQGRAPVLLGRAT